jgi:hypothetical protein
MNTLPGHDLDQRRQLALDDCQLMITWYDKNKRTVRTLFYISQVCIIVLSALTPVLILWSNLPKPLQALPAAVASVCAALNAVFRWRENWVLRAHASEALKRELLKFKTRTSEEYRADLDDQQALANFVARVESLSMNELSEWRVLQMQETKDSRTVK